MNENSWKIKTDEFHIRVAALSIILLLFAQYLQAKSLSTNLCAHCFLLFLIEQEAIRMSHTHICWRVQSYKNISAPPVHGVL